MAKAEYNGKKGVWRTIQGRKVFIADGQSLNDALKASGKFNKADMGKNTGSDKKTAKDKGKPKDETVDNKKDDKEKPKDENVKAESKKETLKKLKIEHTEKFAELEREMEKTGKNPPYTKIMELTGMEDKIKELELEVAKEKVQKSKEKPINFRTPFKERMYKEAKDELEHTDKMLKTEDYTKELNIAETFTDDGIMEKIKEVDHDFDGQNDYKQYELKNLMANQQRNDLARELRDRETMLKDKIRAEGTIKELENEALHEDLLKVMGEDSRKSVMGMKYDNEEEIQVETGLKYQEVTANFYLKKKELENSYKRYTEKVKDDYMASIKAKDEDKRNEREKDLLEDYEWTKKYEEVEKHKRLEARKKEDKAFEDAGVQPIKSDLIHAEFNDKLSSGTLNEIHEEINEQMDKWGTGLNEKLILRGDYLPESVGGQYRRVMTDYETVTLSYNEELLSGGKLNDAVKSFSKAQAKGWWQKTPKGKEVKGVIAHEFGHYLQDAMGKAKGWVKPEQINDYAWAYSLDYKRRFEKFYHNETKDFLTGSEVSDYGKTNPQEWFAESFLKLSYDNDGSKFIKHFETFLQKELKEANANNKKTLFS